ncbi:MAG: FecR domain-containing protein, partial [Bacteroidota bacterium]
MNVTDSDNFNRHLSSYKEGFNPDPEQGLARLYQRLDTAPVVKTATVRSLGQRKWLGIAASLLVLIVAGFLLLREEGATILTNPSPTPMAVELPDGTDVLLQEGASLRYADDYNANDRRVDLDGQAYFQVHKDATRPFLVSTDSTHLRVTGTA